MFYTYSESQRQCFETHINTEFQWCHLHGGFTPTCLGKLATLKPWPSLLQTVDLTALSTITLVTNIPLSWSRLWMIYIPPLTVDEGNWLLENE